MNYFYVKALHIIFVVTWFAGLFYIVRLFIYHTEAEKKENAEKKILQDQFKIMEKRLWYGITWPSAIITLILGNYLGYVSGWYYSTWFWVKYGLVLVLFAYHLSCHVIFRQLQNNIVKYTSKQLRIWNEVATLFLVSIVFIVTLKDSLSFIWGMAGVLLFALIMFLAIGIYKKVREKNTAD
jgi:protoporphyrinogen IX oxidase